MRAWKPAAISSSNLFNDILGMLPLFYLSFPSPASSLSVGLWTWFGKKGRGNKKSQEALPANVWVKTMPTHWAWEFSKGDVEVFFFLRLKNVLENFWNIFCEQNINIYINCGWRLHSTGTKKLGFGIRVLGSNLTSDAYFVIVNIHTYIYDA